MSGGTAGEGVWARSEPQCILYEHTASMRVHGFWFDASGPRLQGVQHAAQNGWVSPAPFAWTTFSAAVYGIRIFIR